MKNMTDKINILGVDISQISKTGAINAVGEILSKKKGKSFFIVTPNPEMLVFSQKNKEFKDILNQADLAIPDGVGLLWASNNLLKERVSGTDLMLDLCNMANQKGYSIGLLGAKEEVAKKTAEVLKSQFPGLRISFSVSEVSDLKSKDNHSCDLLFVAFGAPKQEKWIYKQLTANSQELKANVYMGVGGAFDLISGKIKRAPKFLQDLGLEWFWRLVQEPKRIKRIWTASVVFPWLVVKSRFKH